MPANCSSDVSKVIDYVDSVLLSNDTDAITSLKTKFGLAGVEHNDDFASVLENGPWEWQSNQFYTGYSGFYFFCDSVENVGELFPNATTVPGVEGVGLEKALDGYAKWISEYLVPDSKLHVTFEFLQSLMLTELLSLSQPALAMDTMCGPTSTSLGASIHTTPPARSTPTRVLTT